MIDPDDPNVRRARGMLEEVLEHSRAALDQPTARASGALTMHGPGPMVPDDDPRIEVIVMADLVAAPIGTRIEDTDPSWREYARRLLHALDAVDPVRHPLAHLRGKRLAPQILGHDALHPQRVAGCQPCDVRAKESWARLTSTPAGCAVAAYTGERDPSEPLESPVPALAPPTPHWNCPEGPHRGPEGPNEDLAQCPRCWMPSHCKRPAGETFGDHLPDCSLERDHASYCKPGGAGHPPSESVRG